MTTSNGMDVPEQWGGRLSPSDVHHVLFTRAGLGRRGYDEVEVDVFLERVQQELTRLIAEKADLRDEVARLKQQLKSSAAAPSVDGALSQEEANLQAVRLLAAAQQTADTYVADAEKYSQRLTVDAREHAEQMVEEARRAAQQMVAEAERIAHDTASRTIEGQQVGVRGPTKEELDQQVAYLKTFGQVVRVQLRAYLEALLRDVEEEWGKADPGVLAERVQPSLEAAPSGPAAVDAAPPPQASAPEDGDDAHGADEDGEGRSEAGLNGAAKSPRPRKRTTVSLHSR